jgi:hypothetical protein
VQSGTGNSFSSTSLTDGDIVTVDVINSDGCLSTFGPVEITVNDVPSGTITVSEISGIANDDGIICAGDNVTFTATPGLDNYDFKVNGTIVQSGATNTFSTTTLANGALVSVEVSNANACVSTFGPIAITVNSLPVVAPITGNTSICMNSTTSLADATAGGVWSSSDITIATVDASTGLVTSAAPGTATISYTVTTNGCSSSVNATVTVNALPTPTLTGPNPICLGSTGNIYTTESGQFNYVWNVVNGTVTSGGTSTDNTITVSWLSPGPKSINVNYTDANGCSGATSATVVNSAITAPTITGPTIVCLNSTDNIYTTEGGNTDYTWSVTGGTITSGGTLADNTATITWNSAGAKSVSVNYTDINGCDAASPTVLPVTVKRLPTATISGDATVCESAAEPAITFKGASGTAPYTFNYTINGVSQSPVTTASGNTVTITVPTSTAGTFTYELISVSDNFSCSQNQTGTVTITVNPASVGGIVSTNQTICNGDTPSSLTLEGNTGNVVKWQKSTVADFSSAVTDIANTTTTLSSGIIGALTTTTYFRAVVQSGVCASANSSLVTITVNPLPTANAGPALPAICEDGTSAPLGGSVGGVATGGIWSSPEGGTFTPDATTLNATWTPEPGFSGTATLTLTTTGGSCGTASDSKTIVVNPAPAVDAGPPMAAICQAGTSTTLDGAVGGGATGGTWSSSAGGTFNPNANTLNATWTPPAGFSGIATLTLTTSGGFCGTVSADKTIIVNPQVPTTGVTICQGESGSLTSPAACGASTPGTIGPNFAGAGSTGGGFGDAWLNNPNRLNANDGSYATVSINNNSEALNATEFGFTIPANATINGIQVAIGRFAGNSNSLEDNSVRLLKGGVAVGINHAGGIWPTIETAANYGSASDLWSTTWTPADINDNDFGVALVVDNNNRNNRTANVDYITITVTYTVPGSLNWYTASSGGTAIGNGSPFNPVGVAGSGLPNTNTPGTYTFYAECPAYPGCRTATDFVINPKSTLSSSLTPPARCSGTSGTYIATSTTPETTFSWSRAAVAGISNAAASGSGNTITETLINTTSNPVTVVYAITLTAPPPGNCPNTQNVTVTINPTPVVTNANTKSICSGSSTNINLTANTASSFSWTIGTITGGITGASAGSGSTINQVLTNPNSSVSGTVQYIITPTSTTGFCTGNPYTITVTVNPIPTVTVFADYCAIPGKVRLTATAIPAGATFLWSTGQTGSTIDVDEADTYAVTATSSGCSASASISVAQELVVNGNFESGNTSFTSDYNYKQDLPGLVPAGQGELYDDSGNNGYSITTSGRNVHTNFWGHDHTTGSGNFMAVNGHGNTLVAWKETVNVQPNTTYYFSAWAMSLNNAGPFAQLQFSVNGVLVGTTAVLAGHGESNGSPDNWTRFYGTWTSGPTMTTADIYIVNLQPSLPGNDFGLDDISFGTLNTFIRLESAPGTDGQTVCANSPLTDIVYSVGSTASGPVITGLPPGLTTSFNGVYLTISGTPTSTGTFVYTITTTGTCNPSSATGTITVESQLLNLSSGSTSQTRCVNSAISTIAFAVGGTATGATVSGLPNGVTGVYDNITGMFTISGAPTESGIFNYTVTTSGPSCQPATATGTITVSTPPTADLSGDQTVCNGEAATLTLTVSGTGTISGTLSDGTPFSGTAPTILVNVNPAITTTYTISSLTNGSGCAATSMTGSATVTVPSGPAGLWTGATDEDWFNCRNWANGKVPTAAVDVTIDGTASNTVVIDLTSPYAGDYGYVASAKNIVVDNNSVSFASTNDNLFAAGNLTIQNNGIIDMANGGKIELQGNWNDQVNNAGKGFLSGTGTVVFSGDANQTINALKGTELFYNLGIQKTTPDGLVLLNNDITVDHDLSLVKGIFVTEYNLFTWNNNGGELSMPGTGPGESGSGSYTDSYIATSDALGNPINVADAYTPFGGDAGFRIKNVGNTDTYFPVGSSYLPAENGKPSSPNRMMLNNKGAVQDFTVVVNDGDIGYTNGSGGALRVNRIWYVNASSGSAKATMKLFFTKRDMTGWGSAENEVEAGFNYGQMALVQKDYSDNRGNFINLSKGADIQNVIGAPYDTEVSAQYSVNISNNNSNGIEQFNRFSIVNPESIILPITFINFKAYQKGPKVEIDWITDEERNFDHFEVERSGDGTTFTTILTVKAINNGTITYYNKLDPAPLQGNNFYRVKAIDKNGTAVYTGIAKVNICCGKGTISIYPNPVLNKTFNLQFSNMPQGRYQLVMYNSIGQKLLIKMIEHPGGSISQTIQLPSNIAGGAYFVKVFNPTADFVIPIVIK